MSRITTSGFPVAGFFLAGITAVVSFVAALAVMGWWVPFGWWRVLAMGGAILSLSLMVGVFGAMKVLPIALDLVVLWVAITDWLPAAPT